MPNVGQININHHHTAARSTAVLSLALSVNDRLRSGDSEQSAGMLGLDGGAWCMRCIMYSPSSRARLLHIGPIPQRYGLHGVHSTQSAEPDGQVHM